MKSHARPWALSHALNSTAFTLPNQFFGCLLSELQPNSSPDPLQQSHLYFSRCSFCIFSSNMPNFRSYLLSSPQKWPSISGSSSLVTDHPIAIVSGMGSMFFNESFWLPCHTHRHDSSSPPCGYPTHRPLLHSSHILHISILNILLGSIKRLCIHRR